MGVRYHPWARYITTMLFLLRKELDYLRNSNHDLLSSSSKNCMAYCMFVYDSLMFPIIFPSYSYLTSCYKTLICSTDPTNYLLTA